MKDIYRVQRIPPSQTKEWLLEKHYAHKIPSISYAFGLYQKITKTLVGVCTIGKPASDELCFGVCGKQYKQHVYELNRLVVNDGLPPNSSSYFVGRILRNLHGQHILVSYADTAMSHIGYIYQATNWLYTGATKERTDIFSSVGHSRHDDGDSSKRQVRSSKHRYVYFLGTRRMKKKFRSALNYPVLPYPKGNNERYDASAQPSTQSVMDFTL